MSLQMTAQSTAGCALAECSINYPKLYLRLPDRSAVGGEVEMTAAWPRGADCEIRAVDATWKMRRGQEPSVAFVAADKDVIVSTSVEGERVCIAINGHCNKIFGAIEIQPTCNIVVAAKRIPIEELRLQYGFGAGAIVKRKRKRIANNGDMVHRTLV